MIDPLVRDADRRRHRMIAHLTPPAQSAQAAEYYLGPLYSNR
jgi:hypothetical protein